MTDEADEPPGELKASETDAPEQSAASEVVLPDRQIEAVSPDSPRTGSAQELAPQSPVSEPVHAPDREEAAFDVGMRNIALLEAGFVSSGLSAVPVSVLKTSADSTPSSVPAKAKRKRSRQLIKDLRASVIDGAAFNVMVGLGETYLPAFILAMGFGGIASGMILSIPLMIGAALQMVTPMAVRWLGSQRKWVVLCAATQGLSFLPLAAMGLLGRHPEYARWEMIFAYSAAAIYWGAGLAAGPAWNSWIETIVPLRVRPGFFAWRSRMGQAGVLLGFVVGGLTLKWGRSVGDPLPAFAMLFIVAAGCRLLSARYLRKHSERRHELPVQNAIAPSELLRRVWNGDSERLLVFFLGMQFAVQISGPFFTAYMLGQLKLEYENFMWLVASSFLGKIVAFPACGRIAYRYGARTLLYIGSIGIFPLAGLWIYAKAFPAMLLLQFVGGMTWAAYELAMFLLFFETIRREERTSVLTWFNLLHSTALVAGSLLGALLLRVLGQSIESYLTIFVLSSTVRVGMLLTLRIVLPPQAKKRVLTAAEPSAAAISG